MHFLGIGRKLNASPSSSSSSSRLSVGRNIELPNHNHSLTHFRPDSLLRIVCWVHLLAFLLAPGWLQVHSDINIHTEYIYFRKYQRLVTSQHQASGKCIDFFSEMKKSKIFLFARQPLPVWSGLDDGEGFGVYQEGRPSQRVVDLLVHPHYLHFRYVWQWPQPESSTEQFIVHLITCSAGVVAGGST